MSDAEMRATRLLRDLGEHPGEVLPIAEAALAFAVLDRPGGAAPASYEAHLAELTGAVAAQAVGPDSSLEQRIECLRAVLVEKFGYRGDDQTYDDLVNADLMQVIDRRRGLPVALGILFLHAARAQGWEASGLAFPGHFLIRVGAGGARAILDPFAGGRVCDPALLRSLIKDVVGTNVELGPAHYQAVSDRDVLLRLQNNIKSRLLRGGMALPALAVLDRMLLLAPRHPDLWREAALVNAHLGRLTAGIAAAEQAVAHAATPDQRHHAAVLLQQLNGKLN